MGPAASANWLRVFIDMLAEHYNLIQDEEYPEITLMSLSMTGWSEKGIDHFTEVKTQMIRALKRMETMDVDYVILACNTIHVMYPELCAATYVPIINLVTTCVDYVKDKGCKTIGVLSSETTNRYSVYKTFVEAAGLKFITASLGDEQDILNQIILSVQSGKQGAREEQLMDFCIDNLKRAGADCVILGCTELPLATNRIDVYDSGKILLERIGQLIYE